MKQKKFYKNAAIMIASSLVLRGASMRFRVYLAEKLGGAGMGTYQLIFSVFVAAVAMATSGMFLVSSRLVSESLGAGRPGRIRTAVFRCAAWGVFLSLCAAALLFLFSGTIAKSLVGDAGTAPALRILGLGLPFMSACAVLRGYFVARENTLSPALAELFEQIVTVALPIALLPAAKDLYDSLFFIMLGSTAGEIASCGFLFFRYRLAIRREKLPKEPGEKLLREICRISLPGSIAAVARNLLGSAENLLAPRALRAGGLPPADALAQYGALSAMALPTLYFPAAILIPFSSLLVPEIAKARVAGDREKIREYISFSLRISLRFSLIVACLCWQFAPYLGKALFGSEEVGRYLRLLAPAIPLLYTDSAVDGILKGLDQQFSSCRFNLYDGAARIALLLWLVPRFLLSGYLAVILFSAVFNAFLSLRRMLRVSEFRFPVLRFFVFPLFFGAFSVFVSETLPFCEIAKMAVAAALYFLFLRIFAFAQSAA